MKRHIVAMSMMLTLVLFVGNVFVASAACDNTATAGNDTITCTGTSGAVAVDGLAGNDTIIIDGTLTGNVFGGAGQDTITITENGRMNGIIYGDIVGSNQSADDTIIVNGTLNGTVIGDSGNSTISAGNDTIIINSTVVGNVIGDSTVTNTSIPGGHDTFILQNGANGGADHSLTLIGVIGYDSVVFQFIVNDDAEYQALSALIAAANPTNGNLTWNGETYIWFQMDQLVNDVRIRSSTVGSAPTPAPEPPDGRVNWEDRGFALVAIYCQDNVVQLYDIHGLLIYMSDVGAIEEAFAASPDVNQRVGGAAGYSLWTLNKTDELQVHADDGSYDYIFPASCVR